MSKKGLFCLVFTGVWGETTATMELLAEEEAALRRQIGEMTISMMTSTGHVLESS